MYRSILISEYLRFKIELEIECNDIDEINDEDFLLIQDILDDPPVKSFSKPKIIRSITNKTKDILNNSGINRISCRIIGSKGSLMEYSIKFDEEYDRWT